MYTLHIILLATFCFTMLGGLFALRLKDKLHLVLGFSAGVVVGVAFFDLIPEALDLAGSYYSNEMILTIVALGFLTYLVLDRFMLIHGDGHNHSHEHTHNGRGSLGATSLSTHSFLDGVGIGLAFQVSPAIGIIVAVAVLAHNFSDGINTVNFVLKSGGSRRDATRWLIVDALAPALGIIATLFFTVSATQLGLLLALFAGFFLYIGASDLIPESHHAHPVMWTTVMTVAGAGVIYALIHFAV